MSCKFHSGRGFGRFLLVLLLLVFSIWQNSVNAPHILASGVYFVIPLVTAVAMFEGSSFALLYGLAAGLLWDSVSLLRDGTYTFWLALWGAGIALLVRYFFRRTYLSCLVFCLTGGLLHGILLLLSGKYRGGEALRFALLSLFPGVLAIAPLSVAFYLLVRELDKKASPLRESGEGRLL